MNKNFYSNTEFTDLKERLNREIKRRGTYKWWDPLTNPSIGEDKSSPLSIPTIGDRILVDDKTYTINNSSEGSLERTRNINYPLQGENPGGKNPKRNTSYPDTSAAQVNVDELKNMLIGLAKMQDINLFYGRDEVKNIAFRNPQGIEDAIIEAENSILNKPLAESDCSPIKNDPNGGVTNGKHNNFPNEKLNVTYPMDKNGNYIMPSGEFDGEEINEYEGLGPNNFYDDYGAKPGDSNYHPYNRYISEVTRRDWHDHDNNRNDIVTKVIQGGLSSKRFGPNPRNPEKGDEYISRPVYGGVITNCQNACTGLCYVTCDNQCSESCSTTCWSRCGNACTSSCGNVCTGCSTMCFSSCKTKCENSTGYSCLKAGAKTVKVTTSGGKDGIPAKNNIDITTHSCSGCSYSCQFYPNKKTECWDSGCMGKCFTSCTTSCSTSCYGGCVDNASEDGMSYRTGKGRGCDGGCTLNCIGSCDGVCEGYCVQTCWHACKQKCSDNCSWKCTTNCGNGCSNGCTQSCTGCAGECSGSCKGQSKNVTCSGCSMQGGCTSTCSSDCNSNCVGWGCKSICGTEGGDACESNCRLNCMGTSCTAMCSDACNSQCTTCVNTCGWQCGACSSNCSIGCSEKCNITCSANCEHDCEANCVMSCSEQCGGCSELCYSCVGMCIGVCSIKCQNGCSSCANNCGYWCDSTCNQSCFSTCDNMCIQTCMGSCISFLESKTTFTSGPDRDPTSEGYIYPHPSNRWEERESFKITRDIPGPSREEKKTLIFITVDENRNLSITCPDELKYTVKQTVIHGGVFTYNEDGNIIIDQDMLPGIVDVNKPNIENGGGIYIIIFKYNENIIFTNDDISSKLPIGFELHPLIKDQNNNSIVIIQRDEFLYPEEGDDELNG